MFAIALLSLAALVILGFFYIRQGRTIEGLQAELIGLRQYASELKDEKDVLHAKLGIQKAQLATEPEVSGSSTAAGQDGNTAPVTATQEDEGDADSGKTPAKSTSKMSENDKPKAPETRWGAEVRDMVIDYDSRQKLLKATFRLYNRSVPKKKLSGRAVVVFKNKSDPPIKWFAIPTALLADGQPDGRTGQPFSINNYITMKHRAYGLKGPLSYDVAVVYVFSEEGKLLASRESDIQIEIEPPPPPKPAAAAPLKESSTEPTSSQPSVVEAPAATSEAASPAPAGSVSEKPAESGIAEPLDAGSKATNDPQVDPLEEIPAVGAGQPSGQTEASETEPAPDREKSEP
ncbi:hypothetical protein [Desulfatitalea tepidiphila]|uniref:hypothetical protein n=1 Tax=Desulfatitalea tepidiphila TaxID=1185843 RepID=UPI00128F7F39|nr:hypothetical protein [Desulfatitalea tepidiphila]